MNRKQFIGSLLGLACLPFLPKLKTKEDEVKMLTNYPYQLYEKWYKIDGTVYREQWRKENKDKWTHHQTETSYKEVPFFVIGKKWQKATQFSNCVIIG